MSDKIVDEGELISRRMDRAGWSDVSTVDLLKAMIADIESGRIKLDGVVIAWIYRPGGNSFQTGSWRNLPLDEELITLEIARSRAAMALSGD